MNTNQLSSLVLLSSLVALTTGCSGGEEGTGNPAANATGTGVDTGMGTVVTAGGGATQTGTDTTTTAAGGATSTGTDTTTMVTGGGTGATTTTAGGGASTTTAGGGAGTVATTGGAGASTTTTTGGGGAATAMTGGAGAGTTASGGAGTMMMAGNGGASSVDGTPTTCTFNIMTSEVSADISTVGIVEFSSDLAGISSAEIHFGLAAGAYTMTAPVDLAEANYRTLLLGMKPSSDYHYEIVASNGTEQCSSGDNTVTTGPQANGLPQINITTNNAAALYGGFFITGQYATFGGSSPAYILDADGDFVWWYFLNTDITGVRMSYDNKYMWLLRANVPESQGANVHRVAMDGSTDEDLSSQFAGASHTMTVLPDESVAFFAYGNNGCDDVKEYNPNTGMVKTIINAATAHGAGTPCHLNGIQYSHDDDTLVFSDLDNNNYTKVTRSGEVVWVLGGDTSDFTGAGSQWSRQHGLDILGLDRILIFNNGGLGGGNGGSLALEILLNLSDMTASIPWQYGANPGINNVVMGDVQRLDNGNTLISYSTQGVVHEVDASGSLLQELEFASGGQFGYTIKRASLYGPPPK